MICSALAGSTLVFMGSPEDRMAVGSMTAGT